MSIEEFYKKFFRSSNIATDSRLVKENDIFIALSGVNFDGNKFAEAALKNGACVAVIDSKDYHQINAGTHLVKNTLLFLQELASYHRKKLGVTIIGLTGTNGKTTTKELIREILSVKYNTGSTKGNLNNHIGVPLTLLSFNEETEIGVVEMGANHIGEIETLCKIAQPDSGLITNIGMAHLEGFGSFNGVIKAKSELYQYLKNKKAKIYLNEVDNLLTELLAGYDHIISYNSLNGNCSAKILSEFPKLKIQAKTLKEEQTISLNLYGTYNISNILAAISIGTDLKIDLTSIKKALEAYIPTNNRSQKIQIGTNQLLLDCYNANPTSMKEAINSFAKMPAKRRILILGGMKELGEHSNKEHSKIIELVNTYSFQKVFLVGEEFRRLKTDNSEYFENIENLAGYLKNTNITDSAILIKGSRANKLEQITEYF